MTGTGTQTDPYIVDNWEDFMAAVTQSGVYVKCPENLVWDMSKIAPTGITSHIYFKCAELDGNGLTIRNLHIPANGDDEFIYGKSTIKNVNFLNMDIRKGAFCHHYGAALNFYNCRFSGVFTNAFFYDITGSYTDSMHEGALNLKFNGNASFRDDGTTYIMAAHNCNIKFDYGGAKFSGTQYMRLINSLLTGDVSDTALSLTNSSDSVIDADVSTVSALSSNLSNILINSDKLAQVGSVDSDYYTQVTGEQLTDAAYLSSIGFPIGVDG